MMADQSLIVAVFTPRSVVPTTLMFGKSLTTRSTIFLNGPTSSAPALCTSTPSASIAEHLLEVFFVADQAVDVRHERLGRGDRFLAAPELGAEVEVVADDRAGFVGGLHRFGDDLARAIRTEPRRSRRCGASGRRLR